ncbi:efflux RND transporter periplasmic adaptor subunit [Desulfovibrio sp. OttesenSCG-928-A18]|nr:efflux RND transporter periplasmic adaptor subunit [Desulfovibrio sp. OttesenSCG-928-A18]
MSREQPSGMNSHVLQHRRPLYFAPVPTAFSARLGVLAIILLACLPLFACSGNSGKGDGERVVPIRLGRAIKKDVPRILDAVGNVEAFSTVHVKSQVGGQIIEVPVVAGQEVLAGELLFRLDPRPFDAAVAEAEARLTKNKALLVKAEQDLKRYTTLVRQDVISREAYDLVATNEKTIRADIEQDEAALRTAQLNREYSEIRAPVAGKLGDILVRLGNVIKANDERTLVVINSLRPAEVRFTLAERHLPAVLQLTAAGALDVGVLPEGDNGPLIMGTVTAVNNEVDRTTGSIRLHALFSNEDNRLWPGQFVRVSLVTATLRDAVLVPERAVQEGISGQYVYLASPVADGKYAGKDGYYRVTPVAVDTEAGPDGMLVISKGLQAGDIIVTEGQMGLSPGALALDMGERKQAQ